MEFYNHLTASWHDTEALACHQCSKAFACARPFATIKYHSSSSSHHSLVVKETSRVNTKTNV
jgi:hypothetical protein